MTSLLANIELPPTAHAPRAARQIVRAALAVWGLEARGTSENMSPAAVAELLTSEIVTNAVEHTVGEEALTLRISTSHQRVEISVTDTCPDAPVVRPQNGLPRGRGMYLVNTLAAQWSCDRLPTGKRVWFQLVV